MKSGWAIKKLGEVCELIADGDWIESKDQSIGGIRLIQTGNVGVGVFRNKEGSERFLSSETFKRLNCTEIFGGDILISRLPDPVGRACVVPFLEQRMITAVDCSIVRLRQGVCLPPFLVYYASSAEWFSAIEAKCTGSTRKRISRKNLTDVLVPIPPLTEQKRIVAKIDAAFEKIDKLKANAERNLANAKELFQSALDEAMRPKKGWVEKRLGEVYNFIDYRGKTPNKINEGVPLITARNIRMGYLDYTVKDFISQAEYKTRQSRGIAHKGDILFTTEAPLGFVALADLDEFSTGQRVITFQQYKGSELHLLNEFYFYYFQANGFQGEIRKQATGATAQGIKASRLREIPVAVVPYTEQQSIVKRLDILAEKTKSLEQNYTRQIADCAEMRQSVLREAFEGRL